MELAAPRTPARAGGSLWTAIAATTLVLALAIRGTSFWIDEGFTAWVAGHRSFTNLLNSLANGDSSDLQMGLYNVYIWAWARLFGSSEYALRAANLPFAALLVASFAITSRLAFQRRWGWVAIALSPFLFTYLNEARAYFSMSACAAASVGALLIYAYGAEQHRGRAGWACLAFFSIAALLHMLALFLIPAFAVIVFCEARRHPRRWLGDWGVPVLAFTPVFLGMAAYFLWTFTRAQLYTYGQPGLAQFAFVIYKFVGFGGLGPSRGGFRDGQLTGMIRAYWPTLALGCVALAGVLAGRSNRKSKVLLAAFAAGFCAPVALALVKHSNFLPRHAMALLPVLMFFLLAQAPGRFRLALLAAVWLLSDARLALLPEYAKDDYRDTAHYVSDQAPRLQADIAWAADPLTASYYGLKLANRSHANLYAFDWVNAIRRVDWPVRGQGSLAANMSLEEARSFIDCNRSRGRATLLAITLEDIYDTQNAWIHLIGARQPVATFQYFRVFLLK